MNPKDLAELIKYTGVPLAMVLFFLFLFLRGQIHTDKEFQRVLEDRNHYRTIAERSLRTQEEQSDLIKDAVKKRAEIKSLADMAELVDKARSQGLIE